MRLTKATSHPKFERRFSHICIRPVTPPTCSLPPTAEHLRDKDIRTIALFLKSTTNVDDAVKYLYAALEEISSASSLDRYACSAMLLHLQPLRHIFDTIYHPIVPFVMLHILREQKYWRETADFASLLLRLDLRYRDPRAPSAPVLPVISYMKAQAEDALGMETQSILTAFNSVIQGVMHCQTEIFLVKKLGLCVSRVIRRTLQKALTTPLSTSDTERNPDGARHFAAAAECWETNLSKACASLLESYRCGFKRAVGPLACIYLNSQPAESFRLFREVGGEKGDYFFITAMMYAFGHGCERNKKRAMKIANSAPLPPEVDFNFIIPLYCLAQNIIDFEKPTQTPCPNWDMRISRFRSALEHLRTPNADPECVYECAQCLKFPVKEKCACGGARYCDRTCQQAHWGEHKKTRLARKTV